MAAEDRSPIPRWHAIPIMGGMCLALAIRGFLWPFQVSRRMYCRVTEWFNATRIRRGIRKSIIVSIGCMMFSIGCLSYYLFLDQSGMPVIVGFAEFEPPIIGQVLDRNGQSLIELAKEYRKIVHYQDIPPVVVQAILSAEDKRFFRHSGVDWLALLQVARSPLRSHRGASTITMQIVRQYFLTDMVAKEHDNVLVLDNYGTRFLEKKFGTDWVNKRVRKIQEIRISIWLERELIRRFGSKQRAKEEILSRYASFVYYGNGRYGISSASDYYYDKPLGEYTPDDADKAAVLAGIVKAPSTYAPSEKNLPNVLRRRNEILRLMVENKFLTEAQLRDFQKRSIPTHLSKQKTIAPAIVEHAFLEVKKAGWKHTIDMLFEGRVRLGVTTDTDIQKIANEALEHGLAEYEKRHPQAKGLTQASAVVLRNSDAAILAEVGGRAPSYYTDYNRVLYSQRQPGSAMKPVVYLAAFMNGRTLDTIIADSPISVAMGRGKPAKKIQNYDRKFKGKIRIRQALAESRNAATLRIAREIGIKEVIATARLLGIKTKLLPYPTTALGASEVNLLELANVYRTIASGISAEPYVLHRIVTPTGKIFYEVNGKTQPLEVDPAALREIQEGLRGVVRIPGATAYSTLKKFPIPIFGKTGTTNDFKDALFIGSTYGPEGITIAVRIGFDEPYLGYDEHGQFGKGPGRGLGDKETGGRDALPPAAEIFKRVYEDNLVGPVPEIPQEIEDHIDVYLGKGKPAEILK